MLVAVGERPGVAVVRLKTSRLALGAVHVNCVVSQGHAMRTAHEPREHQEFRVEIVANERGKRRERAVGASPLNPKRIALHPLSDEAEVPRQARLETELIERRAPTPLAAR